MIAVKRQADDGSKRTFQSLSLSAHESNDLLDDFMLRPRLAKTILLSQLLEIIFLCS